MRAIEFKSRIKDNRILIPNRIRQESIAGYDRNEVKNRRISSFKTALLETKIMSKDIAQNGIEGYKTLDDLLNED